MSPGTIFILLFITLGPIKLILPYLNATANAQPRLKRYIAYRASMISTIVVLLLVAFGGIITSKWGISNNGMAITGGVILFIWSMNSLLQELRPPTPPSPPERPTLALAAIPLTVPAIITPAGVAGVLYLTMTIPGERLLLIGLLILVMILNLVSMLGSKAILRSIGGVLTLQVVGGVLFVLQAALAIEVIIRALQRLVG